MSALFLILTFIPFVVTNKHYGEIPPAFSLHLLPYCGSSGKTHENEGVQLPREI